MSDNYYDVLGVAPTASRDEMRDAYRARVDELTAARERKGVSESQLQANRDEVALVRAAWNVLSDPFQRQRYDAETIAIDDAGGVEIVDDGESARSDVQLTGWRRWMAPPPPRTATGAGAGGGRQAPPRRVREPTIPLPPGMHIAQPKTRGMALLFDLAVVILILYAVQLVVPGLVQSDYRDKVDQITALDEASDARKALRDADSARERRDAQRDFNEAQRDFNDAQAQGAPAVELPHNVNQLENRSDDLAGDIRGTQYVTALVTLVVSLAYLVPVTVLTGSTIGMRGRKIKVVRVDGSPAGWYPVFARFVIPILVALAIPTLGPIVGLGIVLWGYRDPNGQGVHDKLARTLVVDA